MKWEFAGAAQRRVKAMHLRWSFFLLYFKPDLFVRQSPWSVTLKHSHLISFLQCHLSHCLTTYSSFILSIILLLSNKLYTREKEDTSAKKIKNFNKEMKINVATLKVFSNTAHTLLSPRRAMKSKWCNCHFKLRRTLEMKLNLHYLEGDI